MKKKALSGLTLTFFCTAGTGLKTWAESGSLERELELYRRLARNLKRVNLVSYGGAEDIPPARKFPELKVLPARWYPRQYLTASYLALRYCPQLLATDILKTNQIRGAQVAVWLKKVFRKKLIVRCGYLHSSLTRKRAQEDKWVREAVSLERKAFAAADIGLVTTTWQRDMVVGDYGLNPGKIRVVPNYVLTDVFKPREGAQKKYDLAFVGRGESEKNLDSLFKALQFLNTGGKNVSLLLVGGCCQSDETRRQAKESGLDIHFQGNVPHLDLPNVLNQARIFVLPSHFEHHPKVLLEAMSCAMPVIGTRVAGIKEEIEHRKTGLLCETDYRSIAEAVDLLLADSDLQKTLGAKAREYVRKNYDIGRILDLELEIIKEL
ncbi:MAG: glycosyltransferase family 4 protein, partial [Candidatus Glassbacteria bacterium]|nr:glycosyltransferase family 4 protein [Candidatus Glassbacteria bacterium]